ncbi:MAG: tRNA (N6-isopentenyl adenosine(37)-C2)-methylthiotransferase MiaB, partial [Candidatus Eisenbacteria bacterium]
MKYYIETYGCQMNVYDSGKVEQFFRESGFEKTGSPGKADVILVNTCSVREHAERRALARIRELGASKCEKGVLAVCGCMAQRLG